MSDHATPELDAARQDGFGVLVDDLMALVGDDRKAEAWFAERRKQISRTSDFMPDVPPRPRERAARKRALHDLIAICSSGAV